LGAWLVVRVGAPGIVEALSAAGWTGLLAISGFHLIATALMGIAWWSLLHGGKQWIFIWGRLVRDAGSEVLPLSQIGGYLLGARAAIVHGIDGATVAASIIVDVTVEFGAQIAYAALGLALFMWLSPGGSRIAAFALIGLGVALGAIIGFIAVQRWGSNVLPPAATQLARRWLNSTFTSAVTAQSEIRQIYRSKRVWWSFLLHLLAWLLTGVEAWLALRLMGVSLSLPVVFAIESLLYAIRSVAFMVPNAIGVQEGAYVMLGAALGLAPDFALGLSLLKRGRDLLLGIPVLVSWQLFESRHQWRTRNSIAPINPPGPSVEGKR
jgi:glycosyltransferase 2 family protein